MAKRILNCWPLRLPRVAGSVSCGLLLLIATSSATSAQTFLRSSPCAAPETFAIDLFEALERPPVSKEIYEDVFALEFKSGTTFEQLQKFLKSTHARLGIDEFDRPLRTRLVRSPSIERLPSKRSELEFVVSLSAYTSRGLTRQRAEFYCEHGAWRVMRFAYEPEKYEKY